MPAAPQHHTADDARQIDLAGDAMAALIDGQRFVLVREHGLHTERVMVGATTSDDSDEKNQPALALVVLRERRIAVNAGLAAGLVAAAFAVAVLLVMSTGVPGGALILGVVALVLILPVAIALRPARVYAMHDPLPGGRDRPALATIRQGSNQRRAYTMLDEDGTPIATIRNRLGRWRLASAGGGPELVARVSRKRLHAGAVIAAIIPGPLGLMLAMHAPWSRVDFVEDGKTLATARRVDANDAMTLTIEDDAHDLDRTALIALATIVLSTEASS